ncbi:MAG: hypothetical protein OCD02_22635 [Spirochaetaceae bacterium]
MRLIKGLMSVFLLSVIFSCATTENTVAVEVATKDESPELKSSEPILVEKEVTESAYFVTKEQAFYGDGQIDSVISYTFNENFELLSRIQTNEQEEVLESFKNTIENGLIIKQENYGFGNVLNTYSEFVYNGNGELIRETLFDDEKKIQSINEYEYKTGNLMVWKTLGSNGGVLALTEYLYDNNNNNVKVEMKTAGGSIDGVIEKSYENNFISEEKILDNKGNVEKSIQYVYKNELSTEKIYFDSKGQMKRSETFEYEGSNPYPIRINYNYKSGALDAYTLVEYDTKTITKTIWVEE